MGFRPVEAHELKPVQPDRAQHREAAPVVGHLLAGHALAVHGEIEDAAGGAVGVVEGQARLVEPHLQHPRLIGDLHSAASENKRPLWHSRLPPDPLDNRATLPRPRRSGTCRCAQSSLHARTGAKRTRGRHRHRPVGFLRVALRYGTPYALACRL